MISGIKYIENIYRHTNVGLRSQNAVDFLIQSLTKITSQRAKSARNEWNCRNWTLTWAEGARPS